MAAVGENREALNLGRGHLQPVIAQPELVDNLRSEGALDEGAGGEFRSCDQFFGDAGTPNQRAGFKDRHLQPGQRQVVSGDQAVMAGANYDGIESGVCH